MTSPDLGGGQRRRRRPGSFCTVFSLLFLLVSFRLPPSTPDQDFSVDSETFFWVRLTAPFVFRSATIELQSLLCACVTRVAVHSGLRSEVKAPLLFVPTSRSEPPFSSPSMRVETCFVRRCSYFHKSEKSRSFFKLSSAPGRSISLYPFNPAGVSSLVRCIASQDRYKLPTPIVWNINSKFPVNFGVLHGSNSVMGKSYCFSGIYSWRADLSCVCILPILNRLCNRPCTASRIDLSSRSILPAIARTLDCSPAELSTGTMTGLSLTGKAISSTPEFSTTVLGYRQSANPFEEAASRGNSCLLTTLIWEKGLGPNLEVESPFAEVNVVDIQRLRPVSIGFLNCWVCCNVKNWTMDPIKLSV